MLYVHVMYVVYICVYTCVLYANVDILRMCGMWAYGCLAGCGTRCVPFDLKCDVARLFFSH